MVAGQRLMQAASDIFLGWQRIKGLDGVTRDYYVRQLHDWKGGADVDTLRVAGATLYARLCGGDAGPRPRPVGGPDRRSPPTWAGATRSTGPMADFSAAYADQNERDYDTLVRAVESGRIVAETER